MDQEHQSPWRPTRGQLLWAGVAAGLLIIAILVGYRYGITLWDWLKLLVVPAVIAGGGLWFNRQQRERELEIAERRAQDEALQAYLDQMSDMLIPNKDHPSLYKAQPGDSLSSVALARTLAVLPRLDGQRKAQVVRFLYATRLIEKGNQVLYLPAETNLSGATLSHAILAEANLGKTNLFKADLSGALLRGTRLRRADLGGANLSKADLRAVNLRGANLSKADLSEAFLGTTLIVEVDDGGSLIELPVDGADLSGVNLTDADLGGADLSEVNLTDADLRGANLSKANLMKAILFRANLSGATGITSEELAQQASSLEGATMPDGQKYEDWLKDREP